MRFRKVMILGYGVIGGHVLDLLARMQENFELIIAGRNEDQLKARVNLTVSVTSNLGRFPNITYESLDVTDVERTAEVVAAVDPDIIVNATSLQTFWLISLLPKELYLDLEKARIGPWLPNHLALALKVMQAVDLTGINVRVVNASFPDVVNPVLDRVGLSPYVGAGNIANLIPTLRRAAAYLLDRPVNHIKVRFVGHHFVCNNIASYGDSGGAPYHLSVYADGHDVSNKLDPDRIFELFTTRFKRVRGVAGQIMASSSVAAVVRAIANDEGALMHTPSPKGLPGGYPVRVGAHNIELALPRNIDLRSAVRVNEEGMSHEGIERIEDDGTVHFCRREMGILKKVLGYECRRMKIGDVDGWAEELVGKFRALANRVGVQLPHQVQTQI